MLLGVKQARERLAGLIREALALPLEAKVKTAFARWLEVKDDGNGSKEAAGEILSVLEESRDKERPQILETLKNKDFLVKKSVWAIGGDAGLRDIGYGGLDHVLASGEDINIFVMDTEVYSNIGRPKLKGDPAASVAGAGGGRQKNTQERSGSDGHHVRQCLCGPDRHGADMGQHNKAMVEAKATPARR